MFFGPDVEVVPIERQGEVWRVRLIHPGRPTAEVLEAAYDDSAGVTAEFNRNVLRVMNRELGADFDPDAFEHVAFFNRRKLQVEMHLRARRPQKVSLEKPTA